MEFGNCKRCHQEIAHDRKNMRPIVCNHCGYVETKTDIILTDKIESKFIKTAIVVSTFIALAFVQVASWDNHALRVLPLQAKSLIGIMSPSDMDEMANICMERKKLDCVEQNFARAAVVNPENRARFAKFLFKRDKVRMAAEQYKIYFAQGGVDLEATYEYARALSQLGNFEEASVLFQQVIDAKPDTVQITVLQHYVRALINANQLEKAQSIIKDVRSKSSQANSFMELEWQQIQDQRS